MSSRRPQSRRRLARPLSASVAWIAARATNALRRTIFVATVSIGAFAVALVALVIVPQQARKAAAAITTNALARPDTEHSAALLAQAETRAAMSEAALVAARAEVATLMTAASAPTAAPDAASGGDTLNPVARSRRDTLAAQAGLLGRLISRSENAPLLASYRALALAGPMQGDARVRQLLDSLIEIERERDSYSAVGGVDPVFVALTARANELGRSIEAVADAKRTAIRREIATLEPGIPVALAAAPRRMLPDTLARVKERHDARIASSSAAAQLARERSELIRLDEQEARARELANVGASPQAMLAAALVFGAIFGFGVALLDEVRNPRISNAREAERASGVRVLGVIRPLPPSPERGRRSAERAGPAYIDPGADGHQLIYQAIVTAGVGTVMLTVTSDLPAVSAIVAINFAAIASDEARSTVLIDTDPVAASVMASLRLRPGAGVTELATGTARWGEVTRAAQLGRDRSIDVIPSGEGPLTVGKIAALLNHDAGRLTRQYDAIVLVSALEQVLEGLPSGLPISDVIYCVRTGQTTIATLSAVLSDIEKTGAHCRGIVIWDAPDPILADLRPVEAAERALVEAS